MADERLKSSMTKEPSVILDELIAQRRSVRRYKKDPLPPEILDALFRCAHQAPSPSNMQPVRFIHIASKYRKDELKQALERGHEQLIDKHKTMSGPVRLRNWINAYRRYADVMFAAPVLLAVGVVAETRGFSSKLTEAGLLTGPARHQTDVDMTVGLAVQNLLLKAQSLGIGSCILTAPLVYIDNVEHLLTLDKVVVKCFVTLGVADEQPTPPERMPLTSVVKEI